ncbi:MAG: SHOCT domain-containing protein [Clostridia bacterium]
MWGYMGGPWGFGAGLMMLVFWILAVAVVLALVRAFWRPWQGGGRHDGALEMLNRRYAAGEITREEYLGIRNDLLKHPD